MPRKHWLNASTYDLTAAQEPTIPSVPSTHLPMAKSDSSPELVEEAMSQTTIFGSETESLDGDECRRCLQKYDSEIDPV